ncbi:hypothetical protein ACWGDT_02185 [Streptomyces avermitilis]
MNEEPCRFSWTVVASMDRIVTPVGVGGVPAPTVTDLATVGMPPPARFQVATATR